MSLIAKLKRRNVFRSALAYAVAGWLLVEVMDLVTETFGAPDWVLQVFVSLVIIGIVPVMVFSWMYEITPEGIKREGEGGVDHSAATTQKLNIAIVIMLAVAIGLFGYQQFMGPRPAAEPAPVAAAAPVPIPDLAPEETADSDAPPMVAALPFTSVSLDGESDFFAVGVHDDLLTQLAKLQSMRVISRTSVLEYKDTTKNIRDIGDELGADIILEGGVQAAGGRIRINAQLIDADTDEHLWAETYDRELSTTNIFDVQRDIANAIAVALNTTLTVQDDAQLRDIPTENMAAYRAWHRALDIRNDNMSNARLDLEYGDALREAIALDPNFLRPRAEIIGAMALDAVGMVRTDPELAAAVEAELEIVRQIGPDSAEYLIAQAYYIYYVLREYDHAYEVVQQALAMNPSDLQVHELKSWIQRRQQRMVPRLDTLRELIRLDPRNPSRHVQLMGNLMLVHQYDELERELAATTLSDHRWVQSLQMAMDLREDGDLERYRSRMAELSAQNPSSFGSYYMEALWATRRYDEVWPMLASVDPDAETFEGNAESGLSEGLITAWLQGDADKQQRYLDGLRRFIDQHRDAEGQLNEIHLYVNEALAEAVSGNPGAALATVKEWNKLALSDPAQFLNRGPDSCKVLGIAGLAEPAVNCLRRFFTEPSQAVPFLAPHLPLFDPVRDSPEWAALMADIEAGQYD